MKIVSVGLGLIGGSFAKTLRKLFPNAHLLGIDKSTHHLEEAIQLGIIDDEATDTDLATASIVILSVPVDIANTLVVEVLDKIGEHTLLADMGSTKSSICQAVALHPKRNQFLAMHPIAGTEFSGPSAALDNLFDGQLMILCEAEKTAPSLVEKMQQILIQIPMNTRYMDAYSHDKHLAYVSHLSHVSSFMLGKTVLDLEKDEREIFYLAGSGFASTVRLAKSNSRTWAAIFSENKKEVLTSLKEYIENLTNFQQMLENNDFANLEIQLKKIQRIKEVLNKE